jgi:hypothetical protein
MMIGNGEDIEVIGTYGQVYQFLLYGCQWSIRDIIAELRGI